MKCHIISVYVIILCSESFNEEQIESMVHILSFFFFTISFIGYFLHNNDEHLCKGIFGVRRISSIKCLPNCLASGYLK